MLKHYVEFLYPGILFSETSVREVKTRQYKKLKKIPKECFGFRYFDKEEIKKCGDILRSKEKNWSGLYCFGEVYTLDRVKKEYPNEKILIGNIDRNSRTGKAIKTRRGNWILFEKNDRIIEE